MPQPSPHATVPRQFRLGADILELLDRIAEYRALRSRAEAIRYAVRREAEHLPPPDENPRESC